MATKEPYRLSVQYGATPSSTVVVPSKERSEFEAFEDLAKKLVKVPKAEIDEKRKEA